MTARLAVRRLLPSGLGTFGTGVAAVGVKELRGRMRGKRAFVILTVHLLVLGGFAWIVEDLQARSYAYPGASMGYASASIGQGVFTALLLLQTALVVLLAPAATAGAISLEREKQTFDMLAATPLSPLAIVVGKLFSALVYVFILILASVPLSALVFVFGGVAPDDVIRGYAVLVVTAIGFGSLGIFFSALARRTQAATMLSFLAVIVIVVGITFAWAVTYAATMANWQTGAARDASGVAQQPAPPPESLLWLNPYFAQADVLCGAGGGFGMFCDHVSFITGRSIANQVNPLGAVPMPAPAIRLDTVGSGGAAFSGPVQVGKGVIVSDVVGPDVAFGVVRDSFWPKYVGAWIVASLILVALSVRLVRPNGGWRRRRPAAPVGGESASEVVDAPA